MSLDFECDSQRKNQTISIRSCCYFCSIPTSPLQFAGHSHYFHGTHTFGLQAVGAGLDGATGSRLFGCCQDFGSILEIIYFEYDFSFSINAAEYSVKRIDLNLLGWGIARIVRNEGSEDCCLAHRLAETEESASLVKCFGSNFAIAARNIGIKSGQKGVAVASLKYWGLVERAQSFCQLHS